MQRTLERDLILEGDIKKIDASFDHEFGTQKETDYEISDFRILLVDGVMEVDITESVKKQEPILYQSYKDLLLETAMFELDYAGNL